MRACTRPNKSSSKDGTTRPPVTWVPRAYGGADWGCRVPLMLALTDGSRSAAWIWYAARTAWMLRMATRRSRLLFSASAMRERRRGSGKCSIQGTAATSTAAGVGAVAVEVAVPDAAEAIGAGRLCGTASSGRW